MTTSNGQPPRPYLLHCVESSSLDGDGRHQHVIAIEAVGQDGEPVRWTLVEVIAAIRGGALFVAGGGQRGQAAVVEPTVCPSCPRLTLVTHPAGALVGLPECR